MPGPDLQQEQQLVLLEDEVFDFDDLTEFQQQQPPPAPPPPPSQQQQTARRVSTVDQDVKDTRAMIASMLEGQRPLMTMSAMDTTPAAYLEYLRTIVNCGRLLRQPALPPDLRQSVAALLARAKPLFCANALNLIVQTVAAINGEEHSVAGAAVPAFWGATFSQHECRLWVELVETLLFFWADNGRGGSGGNGSRDAAFVESFTLGLLDRLVELRCAYSTPVSAASDEVGVERLASELGRRLRPRHLLALGAGAYASPGIGTGQRKRTSPAKSTPSSTRLRGSQRQAQPLQQNHHHQQQQHSLLTETFACFLDAAGYLLPAPQRPLPLETVKVALEAVTIERANSAIRLHRPDDFADNLVRLQRLRRRLNMLWPAANPLAVSALQQQQRQLKAGLDSAVTAAGVREPADLADLLVDFVTYATAACDYEAAWQRAVVKDAVSMAPFLISRLSTVLAANIGPAMAVPGCWETLPERLRNQLEQRSARRLASVTSAAAVAAAAAPPAEESSRGNRQPTTAVDFDIVVLKRADIQPEFLSPNST